jgi:hypothetical protein
MEENDFKPVAPKVAPRDRGPRRFVTFAYLVIAGVIVYALLTGADGFIASVNKFLTATPAPSASPSASPSTSATP